MVIYNGVSTWTAPTALVDKLTDNTPLRHLQPAIEYLLVDEGSLVQNDALPDNNIASLLFRLEHCHSHEQMHDLVHTLRKRLSHDRYDELR